jgi:hypothetical protein
LNEDAKITGYLNEKKYNYQENQNLLLLSNKSFVEHHLTQSVFIGKYEAAKHKVFFPGSKQAQRMSLLFL